MLFILIILSMGQSIRVSGESAIEIKESHLTVWDFKYTDSKTNIALTRVDNIFREKYPEIILEHKGFFDQEYIPALQAALLAGTGPDVIWLHLGTEFTEYQSYLEPLDSFLKETELSFRTSSLIPCRSEDEALKALPLTFQGMGWYYNKELFRQAGLDPENPPSDWNDFLKAGEVLKNKGIIPIATGNNRPLTTEFIRRSLITAFFSEEEIESFYNQGWGFSTPRFRIIMEFCRFLRENEYFDEQGLFRPYFNYATDSFSRGKSAMIPGLISDIAHWKNFSDDLGRDNVGYFPNLLHPAMIRAGVQLLQPAGVLVGINRKSDNKEAAFLYLKHLFSEKSQRILIEDLGMLIPLKNTILPIEEYPILKDIQSALEYTGTDPEKYVPSSYVSDIQYRLDDLLINTLEISLDEYLIKLNEELKLY